MSDDIKSEERNRVLSVKEERQVSLSKLRSRIQRLRKKKQVQVSYMKVSFILTLKVKFILMLKRILF